MDGRWKEGADPMEDGLKRYSYDLGEFDVGLVANSGLRVHARTYGGDCKEKKRRTVVRSIDK